MDFYLYMGLEVGGCSLFADPSGYVGTIISIPEPGEVNWKVKLVTLLVEDGAP